MKDDSHTALHLLDTKIMHAVNASAISYMCIYSKELLHVLMLFCLMFLQLIGLIGPVIAGYIFDGTGSYFWAGIMTGVPLLLSTFFLGKMWIIYDREIRKVKVEDLTDGDLEKVSDNCSESESHSSREDRIQKGQQTAEHRKVSEESRLLGRVV